MFSDVLIALRRAASVDGILVVSGDNGAQQIAGGHGALVLEDETVGHSQAALLGIAQALESGAERVLLVPGDCPLLDPKQIDALVARPVAQRSALIVPDRHGTGTNALLLTPPEALEPSFGPGQPRASVANAQAEGAPRGGRGAVAGARRRHARGPRRAAGRARPRSHGGAAHTRGMLNQLTRSQI